MKREQYAKAALIVLFLLAIYVLVYLTFYPLLPHLEVKPGSLVKGF